MSRAEVPGLPLVKFSIDSRLGFQSASLLTFFSFICRVYERSFVSFSSSIVAA